MVNTGLLDGGSKQDFYQRPEGIWGLFSWSMNPRSYETVRRLSLEDFVSMVSRIAGVDNKKVLSYVKRRIIVRKDEMKGLEEAEEGILELSL